VYTFAARKRGSAGIVLRKVIEVRVFCRGEIGEKAKRKPRKKTSNKISEIEKGYYLCSPLRRTKVLQETGSKLKNLEREKRKKSFGKVKRFTTFADPNGRVLERAKDVEFEQIKQEKKEES
jgi:hypothetical protein